MSSVWSLEILNRQLDRLDQALPALRERYPEWDNFRPAFVAMTSEIKAHAGNHGEYVSRRISAILARHGISSKADGDTDISPTFPRH